MAPKINLKHIEIVFEKYSHGMILKTLDNCNPKSQVSFFFQNNPNAHLWLKDQIVERLIGFRNACLDLSEEKNRRIVLDQFAYLCGNNMMNSEYRGVQFDYTIHIYNEATRASNIDFSLLNDTLSSFKLSNSVELNKKMLNFPSRVFFPETYNIASPDSFKHGFELSCARVHSAYTGDVNYLTADSPSNYYYGKPILKNHNQTNHDMDSVSNDCVVQNDIKTISLERVMANAFSGGQICSVGCRQTVEASKMLATAAINSVHFSKIQHKEAAKNNSEEIYKILKKVELTGEVYEASKLTRFPFLLNSDFYSQ